MQSILHELYYGNISPSEKSFNRGSEYEKTIKTLCHNEEKLLELLNPEEELLLEAVINAQGVINEFSAADGFIDGFCLGMRIGIEVMEKKL